PVHEVDSAVAAILVLASWRRGCCPFQMQLDVSESQARLNRPGAGHDLEISIAQAPGRRPARRRLPGGEILSIEQNDGIGWRPARLVVGAGLTRIDGGRRWPGPVVYIPVFRRPAVLRSSELWSERREGW